jgi:hypothetical protein
MPTSSHPAERSLPTYEPQRAGPAEPQPAAPSFRFEFLAPILAGVPTLPDLADRFRLGWAIASAVAAAVAVSLCHKHARVVAQGFVVLTSTSLALLALLGYHLYPLAPIAFLGVGAAAAGIPVFFSLTRGRPLGGFGRTSMVDDEVDEFVRNDDDAPRLGPSEVRRTKAVAVATLR